MAHIWVLHASDAKERGWQPVALAGDGCDLRLNSEGVQFHSPASGAAAGAPAASIRPVNLPGPRSTWTLLAGDCPPVSVNGRSLALGIHRLRDKDDVRVGPHRMFFSTEELARVVAFPGLAEPAHCPRCKREIKPGDLGVRCPSCQAWSHQTEQIPCWTHDPTCALCGQQSTDLDAGFNFDPGML